MLPVHFALRLTPDSPFYDLRDCLVAWPSEVENSAENRFNEFRGTQFSITLDDSDGRFGTPGAAYHLSGGEEISVWLGPPPEPNQWDGHTAANGSKLFWAGTIDPAVIHRSQDSNTLKLQILQHGSLLNTIEAGLPDWTVVAGQAVPDESRYHRYKGTADQWLARQNEDGTFGHNEIEDQNVEVYYTPSAYDALEDELYKAKMATKVHHFHTFSPEINGVEYPYPQVFEGGYENVPGQIWIGQFKPHYRPDFTKRPEDWDNQGGITQDPASYTRVKEPTLNFRRRSITTIVQELVRQFNRTAKFPLTFDPATDAVILSPQVSQAIEILNRQPNVSFVDLRVFPAAVSYPERIIVLVNYNDDPNSIRCSVYVVENETELLLIRERIPFGRPAHPEALGWPTFQNGARFARASTVFSTPAIFYNLQVGVLLIPGTANEYGLTFDIFSANVNLTNLNFSGVFQYSVHEELGEFSDFPLPPAYIVNRSANINSSGVAHVRNQSTLEVYPPELEPEQTISSNGRVYSSRAGGLTVSGALFDRVAVDAENIKLSALISEIAKITFSKVSVTADRRLKLISRRHFSGTRHTLKGSELALPLDAYTKSFDTVQLPSFGSGLVLPENFKQAAKNWFEDQVLRTTTQGGTVTAPAEAFDTLPAEHDALYLADGELPPITDSAKAQKYGSDLQIQSVKLLTDHSAFQITAEQPLI